MTDPLFQMYGSKITAKNLEGLDLVFLLPYGVTLLEEKKQSLGADKPSSTYRIPAEEKGILHFEVSPEAEMPVLVEALLVPQTLEESLAVSAASESAEPVSRNYIALLESNSVKAKGGKAQGLNGRVKVDFPSGALSQDAHVFINHPLPESMPPFSLSGNPFEINAYPLNDKSGAALQAFTADRENKGKEINKFNQEVEIEVAYDESLYPNTERDLVIYWYDEETGQWDPLLSHVNTEENVIRAVTNHFTVFDINVNNWQASRLPTIETFQVSEFTGAGTFHFPIEVPPGPGGLQPSISLDYNSQVVDSASTLSQASWVGMGWSLDVGTIERNSNGTPTWTGDDSFFLSFNGVSSTIVNVGGVYRLSDENFWKIEKLSDPDRWEIKDKVGNTYVFGYVTHFYYPHEEWDKDDLVACHTDSMPIRWSLQQVRNIHGQVINYSYSADTKIIQKMHEGKDRYGRTVCKPNEANTIDAATATYVSTIAYGGYRVRFEREARDDYTAGKQTDPYYHAFERTRLKTIYIENQTGSSYAVVRKYVLGYETDPAKMIFPGVVWTQGGRNTTLASIQEVNPAGTKAIASYSFLYGDNRHLTLASNMHGASVKFDYEPWGLPSQSFVGYATQYRTIAQHFGLSRRPCSQKYSRHPEITYGEVACEDNTNAGDRLIVNNTIAYYSLFGSNMVIPGAAYRLTAAVASGSGSIQLGLQGNNLSTAQYLDGVSGVLRLPADSNTAAVLIKTSGMFMVDTVKIELLTAGYRVKNKTVMVNAIPGVEPAHSYVTSYAYSGEDVNRRGVNTAENLLCPDTDPYNPPENPGCFEYVPEYSEFRGHSLVIKKVEPDGPITETYYYQDHLRKGRVAQVKVKSDSNNILKWSFFAYPLPDAPSVVQQPFFDGCHVGVCSYTGLYHAWVPMKAQQHRIYAIDQTYTATREEYKYDNYGNQVEVLSQYQYGENTPWINHIRTETEYYPNTNGVYLVGLPGKVKPYDTKGTPETNDDVPLSITLYQYDGNQGWYSQPPSQGKLTAVRTKISEPDQYTQVSYEYDQWGNRVSETTWSGYGTGGSSPTTGGRTTTTVYDSIYHTYPISVTNPLNQTISWTYNYGLGVPVSETDPNGALTTAAYDDFGRLVKLVRPGDDSTYPTFSVSYSNGAPFETIIRQRLDGNRYFGIRRVYDGMGRQVLQQSGSGTTSGALTVFNTVDTNYISAYETWQRVPFANGVPSDDYTKTVVDPVARSTTVIAPDGSQTVTVVNGLTTTITDPAGRVTTSQADVWGRTVSVTPPDGPGLTYTYDLLGRLLTATRGSSTTALTYDMAGRKIAMSDPDMGNWSYTYDALGNLISQTDARGCSLTLSYDLLNRLTAKNSSGTGCGAQVNTTYTYDAGANGKDRRTAMSDASGTAAWSYDARGRLRTEIKTISGQTYLTQWTYNSADLPVTITYPDGEVVTNAYDENMLLESVIGANPYVQSSTYDVAGRLTERSLGNGLTQVYSYYAWDQQGGRLQSLTTTGLQNLSYQYSQAGNITQIQDTIAVETQAFEYDDLDRLTRWSLNGVEQETYAYDPATGNLQTKAGQALVYNDAAHVHAATGLGSNSYVYDENGNQTTRNIYGDSSYTLSYDAENRLVEVEKAGATIAQFTYDGDGKRVIGVENGQTTHYVGGHYEKVLSGAPQQFSVAVPTSTFDTNTTWQSQQTSPGTWLWRTNWWGAHSGTTNQVITNNAYGNLTSKPIVVTPNTQYVLSGWVRGKLNDQIGEAGWIIRASYYTSTDQYISYADVAYGTGSSLSTTWAQKSGTVTTPANAAFVRVSLFNHLSSGWVAFDDISFKKNGTSTELLEDPGFELGTGWATRKDSPGTYFMREGWLGKRSGSFGYTITNNAYGDISSHSIPVSPNTQYTLSGWVRGELDDTQGMAGWFLRVTFYDANGQQISYLDAASGNGANTTTTWAQKSGTVTSPANAVSARVFLCNHLASGWVAFDDISFKQSHTTTELLSNTGFETDSGWTANQGMPATWLLRAGWGDSAPRTGSFSYLVTNTVYGDLRSKLIPVTAGALYDVSTWIRGEVKGYQGEGGFILRVEAYDTNGQYMNYADLAASYQGVTITPTWQQLQRQYTAPAGAAYIRVRMFNHRASGWAAFDDLSVKKTDTTTELLQNPGFETVNSTPLNSTSISNGYAVTAGAAYSITANVRGEKSDPSGTWQMRANFYDTSGQLLESKELASQATQTIGLAPGTVAANLIAPAGATALKIELKANFTTGWINFSDILVTKADGVVTKYYFAGAQRVAMRKNGSLSFLLSDHLGSTSITTDAAGTKTSELRYSPWGEVRTDTAWSANPGLPTDYTFTGQYSYMDDPTTNGVREGFGLMFYNARWYDPALGRFAQADTIIPAQTQGTQAWDRYAYVNNNPLKYTDPSGHKVDDGCRGDNGCTLSAYQKEQDAQKLSIINKQARLRSNDEYRLSAGGENRGCGDIGLSPDDCSSTLEFLTASVLGLDQFGYSISALEAFLANLLYAGVIATGQIEALPVALQGDMMIAGLGGVVENWAGYMSLAGTIAGDYLSGYSYVDGISVYVGQDTLVSLTTSVVGTIPESNLDLAASHYQLAYDTERIFGNKPNASIDITPTLLMLAFPTFPLGLNNP